MYPLSKTLAPLTRRAISAAFDPSTVSGLVAWFDFSDISTMFTDAAGTIPVASNGDVIGRINDKRGNGVYISQTITSEKPTYRVSIKNGLSAALFLDDRNFLISPTAITHNVANGNFHSFSAWKRNANFGMWRTLWCLGTFNPGFYYCSPTIDKMVGYFGLGNSYFDTVTVINNSYISENSRASNTVKNIVNGVQDATTYTNSTNYGTSSKIILGCDREAGFVYLGAYYYEFLLYASEPSAGDVASIRGYLNNKWAVY